MEHPWGPDYVPEPPWRGPGDGVVGGPVYAQPVLVRRDDLLVVIRDVLLFPFGMRFGVHVIWPRGERWPGGWWTVASPGEPVAEGGLALWAEFADGTIVRDLGAWPRDEPADGTAPREPRLIPRGAYASGPGEWQQEFWLWPEPPPGDLVLAVAWPDRGVPPSRGVLSARQLDDARTRIIDP